MAAGSSYASWLSTGWAFVAKEDCLPRGFSRSEKKMLGGRAFGKEPGSGPQDRREDENAVLVDEAGGGKRVDDARAAPPLLRAARALRVPADREGPRSPARADCAHGVGRSMGVTRWSTDPVPPRDVRRSCEPRARLRDLRPARPLCRRAGVARAGHAGRSRRADQPSVGRTVAEPWQRGPRAIPIAIGHGVTVRSPGALPARYRSRGFTAGTRREPSGHDQAEPRGLVDPDQVPAGSRMAQSSMP